MCKRILWLATSVESLKRKHQINCHQKRRKKKKNQRHQRIKRDSVTMNVSNDAWVCIGYWIARNYFLLLFIYHTQWSWCWSSACHFSYWNACGVALIECINIFCEMHLSKSGIPFLDNDNSNHLYTANQKWWRIITRY